MIFTPIFIPFKITINVLGSPILYQSTTDFCFCVSLHTEDVLGEQINLYPIEKIGEVQLSCEIGGFEISKKTNFIITIRYEIPTFSSVEPFSKRGGWGLENFGQNLKL